LEPFSRLLAGLALWAAYTLFVMALWAVFGIDYDMIGLPGNVVLPLILPIGGGGLLLAFAVTRLGWWEAVLREDRPGAPHWLFWPLFGFFLLYCGQRLWWMNWTVEAALPLMALAVGLACVGFSEELLHRGILVHALRARLSELWVWFGSSALFGLLHVPNAFFTSEGLGAALPQAGFAFLTGSALYLVRRLGQRLWPCMALHFLWDFCAIGPAIAGGSMSMFLNMVGLFGLYAVSIIALGVVLAHDMRKARQGKLSHPA
jgi:membrane protease YdiL (CAAX protease family)